MRNLSQKLFGGFISVFIAVVFLIVISTFAVVGYGAFKGYSAGRYVIRQQGFNRYGDHFFFAESIVEHTPNGTKYIDAITHKEAIIDGPVSITEK